MITLLGLGGNPKLTAALLISLALTAPAHPLVHCFCTNTRSHFTALLFFMQQSTSNRKDFAVRIYGGNVTEDRVLVLAF